MSGEALRHIGTHRGSVGVCHDHGIATAAAAAGWSPQPCGSSFSASAWIRKSHCSAWAGRARAIHYARLECGNAGGNDEGKKRHRSSLTALGQGLDACSLLKKLLFGCGARSPELLHFVCRDIPAIEQSHLMLCAQVSYVAIPTSADELAVGRSGLTRSRWRAC